MGVNERLREKGGEGILNGRQKSYGGKSSGFRKQMEVNEEKKHRIYKKIAIK